MILTGPTLKETAQYVYDHFLKNEYTDTSNKAAWVYPTAQDIKRDSSLQNKPTLFRPNHGLAHTLRVMSNVKPIVEYFKKFATHPEDFQFTPEQIKKLEICALFSVSGRENDTGWAGNPEQYMNFRRKSGENFEQYCREHNVFDSEAELQEYKKHLIEMGTPENKNPIHVVINMAHKLDLLRCFKVKNGHSTEAVLEYLNEHSSFKNNIHMLNLIQYAIDNNRATGNRLFSILKKDNKGAFEFDRNGNPIMIDAPNEDYYYHYEPFFECSTNVDFCLDKIQSVKMPEFITNEKVDNQSAKEKFQQISHTIKNCEMAIRTINNNTQNINDLRYEMNDWVNPQHSRYIRAWWKDEKWIGDKRYYRDQITGKLIERPVTDNYVPFDEQTFITEPLPISHYWQIDEHGKLQLDENGKPIPIVKPVDLNWDHMGLPKKTIYTKKRSFSLLRPDAKMIHFKGPGQTRQTFLPIGLGADVNQLHQKGQRYIWLDDTRTSEKFWLGNKAQDQNQFHDPKYPERNHGVWLEDLQNKYLEQAKNNEPANWYNEMLMGGKVDALNMIFSTENSLTHRLNLLFGSLRLKHEFKLDLPLMIIDGENPAAFYSKEQMLTDLVFCAKHSKEISADDKNIFDKLVHSLCNAYRWENELTSLVDFNSPKVIQAMKEVEFDGAPLDDDARKNAGKEILSADHKLAELMKNRTVDQIFTTPSSQEILAKMVFQRLDTINHHLSTKDYPEIDGLTASKTHLPHVNPGHTPLTYALAHQEYALFDELINMGADAHEINSQHWPVTPLMWAASKSQDDVKALEQVLKYNVDINQQENKYGYNALMYAASQGYTNIVKCLLQDNQINLFLISKDGKTALEIAKTNNHPDIAELIFNAQAQQLEFEFNRLPENNANVFTPALNNAKIQINFELPIQAGPETDFARIALPNLF